MNQEKIGKFIKQIRKDNNLTQNDLANKLGVTYQAVSKWENGKNIPDVGTLKLISETFNIDIDELLYGEKKIKKSNKKIIYLIIILIILLIGVFLILNNHKSNNFEFKSLGTTCEEFKLNGSAAYNKDKSAIYISNISYCGKANETIYKTIECTLYEEYNDTITKISSCESKNNLTLENYLSELSIKIDNYNSMCKKFNDSNMYLEINASENNQIVSYKIPITLEEDC